MLRPLRPILFAAAVLATSTAHAELTVGSDGLPDTSIVIDVPAFHRLTPSVRLQYSAMAGYGLAGAGWSLRAGGQITRQSATGGIAHDAASDRLLLDGVELVACTTASTSPGCKSAYAAFGTNATGFFTTKLETFRRIQQTNKSEIVVWDPDGTRSTYATGDGGVSYQLRTVDDLRGHRATYEWTCNQGCELDAIRYGAKNGAPGTEIQFYREPRPDPRTEAVANGFWYHGERLRSIVVRNHGQLLRAYAFSYKESLETRASILTGVQQFGRDATVSATGSITPGPTAALPMRTFGTESLTAAGGFELVAETSSPSLFDTSSPAPTPLAPRYPDGYLAYADVQDAGDQLETVTPNGLLAGDFNGDGREEIVAWGVRDQCTKIRFRTYVTSNTGAPPTQISTPLRDAGTTADCQQGLTDVRMFRLDVDGDSIDDAVLAIGDELRVYEGQPSGMFAEPTVSAWDSDTWKCVPADVDGNGRQDLVCELPGQLVVRRSTPSGWLVTTLSTSGVVPSQWAAELAVGDVDGDSLDDIILAHAASGSTRVVLGRSRGDGTLDWTDEQTFAFTGKLATGDVDGDGQLDLMWSRKAGVVYEVDVAVARKGYSSTRWVSVPRQTTTLKTPELADVDGDGRSDLLGLTSAFEMRAQRATSDGMFGPLEAALATCPDSPAGIPAQVLPADWNGDGLLDPTCAMNLGDGGYTLSERPGQPRGADRHRWQRADLDGDGRTELVYVAFKNPGYIVHVVSPSTNQHKTFIVDQTTNDRLREPDASRWVVADFGSPAGPADGKDDLVLAEVVGGHLVTTTLLSTGLATFQVVQQDIGLASATTRGWFAAADDRDGRAALMRVSNMLTSTTMRVEWLQPTTAGNFARVTSLHFDATSQWPLADRAARRFRATDVDADGLTDLVLVDNTPGSSTTIVRTLRADGSGGFVESASTFTASWIGPRGVRIADLDGDGAPDLYHVARSGTSNVCLSISHAAGDGHGGFAPGSYSGSACVAVPTNPLYTRLFESSSSIVALDLDHDGRPELVHATHARNASGAQQLVVTRLRRDLTGSLPQWRATHLEPSVPYDLGDAWAWAPYQDSVSGDTGLAYVHPNVSQILRWRHVRDELTQIANGLGLVETISYLPLASASRAYLPAGYTPRVVYGTTIVDQGGTLPTIESVQYGYGGATWSNEQGRLLGFATTYANDGRAVRFARYALGEVCGPQLVKSETQDLTGAMWGWSVFTYGAVGFPCVPKTTTTYESERTTGSRVAKFEQLGYDDYGNVTSVVETADRAPLKLTATAFVRANDLFIIDKVSARATYGHDGTALRILSSEQRGYDYQASGVPPVRGELTSVATYDDQAGQYLTTRYAYDTDGNIVTKTSPSNVLSTFDYDPIYRRYLTATCSALHCTRYEPDFVLGATEHTIAPNGGHTWIAYDAHGRARHITDPRGGTTELKFLDTGVFGWQRVRTEKSDGSPGDGVLWTERFFDGNGRTHLTTREGGATSKTLFADNSERPWAISNIYPWGGTPKLFTEYMYDGIGRLIETRHPDGKTRSTTYEVGVRVERDELAAAHRFELDGRGASVRVTDPLNAVTRHERDALGRIIEIVDAYGNIDRRDWSTRGLLASSRDPDRGLVSMTYTPDGALDTRRDSKQQLQVFKYDGLGRLESRHDRDAGNAEVRTITYTYDDGQAQHDASKGMLVAIDDSQATTTISEEYWYDAGGLVTQTQRCVDKTCMLEGITYDIAGRIETRHYPDADGNLGGEDVLHQYDAAGRLVQVGSYATLGYELDDALSSIAYGNGVHQSFAYDLRRRSLDAIDIILPSGASAKLDYRERDAVGRILRQRAKGFVDVDLVYNYDALGRLRGVTSPDVARNETITYDALGRIDTLTGLGTFAYNDPAHAHGMTSTTQGGFREYDANGNVTRLGDPWREMMLEWTVDDRIASVRTSNATYHYAHDFAGRRVRKEAPSSLTQYFGPRLELEGKHLTKRYFAGNRVVAERDDQGVTYPIEDGNRNVRAITDANGNVTQTNEYTAFGKVMQQGSSLYKRTFSAAVTDLEQDLGLVLMGARTYDPVAGQFLSADSIIPSLDRPQSLNRYSYVENDPINYNDPSGHMRLLVELRKLRFEEMGVLMSYEEAMLRNPFVLGFDRGASLSATYEEQYEQLAKQYGFAPTHSTDNDHDEDESSTDRTSGTTEGDHEADASDTSQDQTASASPASDAQASGLGHAPGAALIARALGDLTITATGDEGEKSTGTELNYEILASDNLKIAAGTIAAFFTASGKVALLTTAEVGLAATGGFLAGTWLYDLNEHAHQNAYRSPWWWVVDTGMRPWTQPYRNVPDFIYYLQWRRDYYLENYVWSPDWWRDSWLFRTTSR